MKSAAAKGRKLFRLVAAALLATLALAPQNASADAVGYPETRLRVFDLSDQVGDRVDSQLSRLSHLGYRHSYDEEVVGSLLVPERGGINLLNNRGVQARPSAVRFGPARGGGGDEIARRYARQVTGDAEWGVYVRNVEFEGVRAGTLLDAKYARSSRSFYDISGADRFTRNVKIPKLLRQARRQVDAIEGLGFKGIEWHFADEAVARSVRRLFARNRIPVSVRYTPLKGAP